MIPDSHPPPLAHPARATVLLACLRPHLLLPAYLSAATGFIYFAGPEIPKGNAAGLRPGAVILGWSLVLAAVNAVNLLSDQDTDRLNGKNLFWMDILTGRSLALTAGLLSVVGLCVVAWAKPAALIPVGATLALGLAYSLRPLQLSRRWGWDALANVIGYGVLAPWIGGLAGTPAVTEQGAWPHGLNGAAVLHLAPIVFAAFLLTTILDHDGDHQTGKISWSVRFTRRSAGLTAVLVLIGSGILARWGGVATGTTLVIPASGPAGWFLKPGSSPLIVAGLAALAVWMPRGRRKLLVAAIFASVLAAGGPALLLFPRLAMPLGCWLFGSYLLLLLAGKISGSVDRAGSPAPR
jgi:UbiA prenyltransferase family